MLKDIRAACVASSNLRGGHETQVGAELARSTYRDTCGKCGARRVDRQIGLEASPAEFVQAIVAVFREVKRVLHPSGVAWVNLGDSYAQTSIRHRRDTIKHRPKLTYSYGLIRNGFSTAVDGLKPKDLLGIPWAVAFALRDDGWYLRDAITWAKAEVDDDDKLEGSAMPGSQRDRCTSASELIFMLTKSARYYFDHEGCKTSSGAMLRNVWRMNAESFAGAHYATFPRELPRRAILLGTSERGCCPRCRAPWVRVVERESLGSYHDHSGDFTKGFSQPSPNNLRGSKFYANYQQPTTLGWRPTCKCFPPDIPLDRAKEAFPIPCTILDPFCGSGTSIVVAQALGRDAIGLDLSREYLTRDAQRRITRPHSRPIRPSREEVHPLFPDD